MMKKRLLSAVMASAMVLSLAACGGAKTETTAAETTAEKKEETTTADTTAAETAEAAGGTLIVGFDQDFPPMGFVGDNGEYTGFDLDLAKEVASRLGLEYKAQPVAWDSKDMELESGNIDCIWNGFTITGREDDYTWTLSLNSVLPFLNPTPYSSSERESSRILKSAFLCLIW